MSNTFTIGSVTARYAREFFNEAYHNERSLEVALGRWFLARVGDIPVAPIFHGQGLPIEVGCVLPYYGLSAAGEPTYHEVIDLADEHPASRKVNALSLDYRGRHVLSISTIEHMSSREYGNASDEDSITFLKQVLAQSSKYLVTWGVGYNPTLDAWVRANPSVPRTIMKRINWQNEYRQMTPMECDQNGSAWSLPFGHSDRPLAPGFFNNANGVVVVTNLTELLPE